MYLNLDSDSRSAKELIELFEIKDSVFEAIIKIRPAMLERMDEMLGEWYLWLESLPEYEEFFPNKAIRQRVQSQQYKYWDRFFSGHIDEEYIALRMRLGETHARIGLGLDTYFASVDHFLEIFVNNLRQLDLPEDEFNHTRRAVNKLTHLDMTLMVIAYEKLVNESIAAQSKALLEMSTPVTQIWNGILLLPLVGIIDSKRAQDIMNSTLGKISETQARSFILDISGVAVVDTAVANHLVKITKATRLMGCESTISGVSPAIAQTMVDLGIDVGTVKTTSNMRTALLGAFEKQGIEIRELH